LFKNNINSLCKQNFDYIYSNEDFFFAIYSYNIFASTLAFIIITRFVSGNLVTENNFNNTTPVNNTEGIIPIKTGILFNAFNLLFLSVVYLNYMKIIKKFKYSLISKKTKKTATTLFNFLYKYSNPNCIYKKSVYLNKRVNCVYIQNILIRVEILASFLILYVFLSYILSNTTILSRFIVNFNFFFLIISVLLLPYFTYEVFIIKYFIYTVNVMYLYVLLFDLYSFSVVFEFIYIFIVFALFYYIVKKNNYKNLNSLFFFIILNFFGCLFIFLFSLGSLYLYGSVNILNTLVTFTVYSNNLNSLFVFLLLLKINISPLYRFNSIIYSALPYFIIFLYTVFYFFIISIYIDITQVISYNYFKYLIIVFMTIFLLIFDIKKLSDFIFFSTFIFFLQLILIFS